jgi:hypothetical protein
VPTLRTGGQGVPGDRADPRDPGDAHGEGPTWESAPRRASGDRWEVGHSGPKGRGGWECKDGLRVVSCVVWRVEVLARRENEGGRRHSRFRSGGEVSGREYHRATVEGRWGLRGRQVG